MENNNLGASPKADRSTLIERASLDLTGLRPSYQEVQAFVADNSPDAYEKLIGRLLDSPHYGERWGRYWLDVARYGEDNPTSEATNPPYPFAWRYRDWVIQAINKDVPYDKFVTLQLAAAMVPGPPRASPRAPGSLASAPHSTPVGRSYLTDLLETMGVYVDTLKYAGGSFALMPRKAVRALNDLCHEHNVAVSTGGFLETVLGRRGDAVARYLDECAQLGFDIVEISSGFVTLPAEDLIRLTETVCKAGLKAKPEVGIQFGAGGTSSIETLEADGTRDLGQAIELAKRHLDAGAQIIMIESEGITEQVREWRTDVVSRIVSELGLEHAMFEAADPDVFTWYIRNYGIDVNLFVDHSQIVQLECLRAGIWGPADTWGRMLSYRAPRDED